MVDFVKEGVTLTLSETEKLWEGGRGSFIVDDGGTTITSAKLQATFDAALGPQDIDAALTVTATGVVNFELPRHTKLSVVATEGAGTFALISARRITEIRAT